MGEPTTAPCPRSTLRRRPAHSPHTRPSGAVVPAPRTTPIQGRVLFHVKHRPSGPHPARSRQSRPCGTRTTRRPGRTPADPREQEARYGNAQTREAVPATGPSDARTSPEPVATCAVSSRCRAASTVTRVSRETERRRRSAASPTTRTAACRAPRLSSSRPGDPGASRTTRITRVVATPSTLPTSSTRPRSPPSLAMVPAALANSSAADAPLSASNPTLPHQGERPAGQPLQGSNGARRHGVSKQLPWNSSARPRTTSAAEVPAPRPPRAATPRAAPSARAGSRGRPDAPLPGPHPGARHRSPRPRPSRREAADRPRRSSADAAPTDRGTSRGPSNPRRTPSSARSSANRCTTGRASPR